MYRRKSRWISGWSRVTMLLFVAHMTVTPVLAADPVLLTAADETYTNTGTLAIDAAPVHAIDLGDGGDTLNNSGTIDITNSTWGAIVLGSDTTIAGNDKLVNTGTIEIQTAGEVGISFCSGDDTLDNRGLITISDTGWGGITFGSGDDTLTNSAAGQIYIDDSDYAGISFGDGIDTFTNAGLIDIGYTNCASISFGPGDDSLTNSGTIIVRNSGASGLSFGDSSGTSNDTLVNTGRIEVIYSDYSAIVMGSGDDTFTNSGTVKVGYAGDAGINLGDGIDSFSNTGTITIDYAYYPGIQLGDGEDTFTNSGTISIRETYAGPGIGMGDGDNSFTNSGTITIGQTGNAGMSFGSNNDSFTNSGTFGIDWSNRAGMAFADGDDSLTNSGTFAIDFANYAGISFASGNDSITNSGTFTISRTGYAGISFAEGDDTLTNSKTLNIGYANCEGISFGSGIDTLTNSGTLSIDFTNEAGITFGGDADLLDNKAGATLTISRALNGPGMSFGSGDDTLDNAGTISIGYANNAGISFGEDNDTFNNLKGATLAIAHAGTTGLSFGSGDDTLDNAGTIDIGFANNVAIQFEDGADTLVNSGTITIDNAGCAGIHMQSGNDTFENKATGKITIGNSGGFGIQMYAGDDVFTNAGTIDIGYTNCNAINLGSGNDSFENTDTGKIAIDYTAYNGISMCYGSDTFTNAGTIDIGYANSNGILFYGLMDDYVTPGVNSLTNTGTITIGYANSNGIDMGSGQNTLDNDGGTINIQGAGYAGISMGYSSLYNSVMINSGTINITNASTGIEFGSGDDTVTLSGPVNVTNAEYAFYDNGGTDTMNLQGTADLALEGEIYGFEVLNKDDAGTWTLNAPSDQLDFYDAINVNEGTLLLNSDDVESSVVTVASGATLGGEFELYGHEESASLTNSGTVAPGSNGIGTVYVDGDYTQNSDGILAIQVGTAGAADLLEVSGTAALDGTLQVTSAGYVQDGDSFTIVDAGTLGTEFATLSTPSVTLQYAADYSSPGLVILNATRVPYADLGINGNALTMADALLGLGTDGEGVLGMIDNLSSAGAVQDSLSALSPEAYPNLLDIGMAGSSLYRSSVSARMSGLHLTQGFNDSQFASNTLTNDGPALSRVPAFERTGGGFSAWARVLGATGDQDSDGGIQGYEFDTYGISLGVDNKISDNLALGIGFGYAESDVEFDISQDTDVESYNFALYGTYSKPQFYIDGAIQYATSDYDSDRDLPMLGETASSSTDGSEWGLYLGAGYNMVQNTDWYFTPTASIEWAQADIDGFTEKGASLNLTVDDYDADSLVTTLGFRVGANMAMGETKFVPEFRLAWAHEFGDTERDVKAAFVGTPGSTFTIDGVEPDEDGLLVGVGANASMTENMTLFLDYDGEFRGDFTGHSVSAGLRYNF